MSQPTEDEPEIRPCSNPRSMMLEIVRGQQLKELREELAYWTSDARHIVSSLSPGEIDASVRFLRKRISGLEDGTIGPDDVAMP